MRIPSLPIVFALLGSSAWAQHEESHYYAQFGLGAVFSEDASVGSGFGGTTSFDPGYSAGLAFGRNFRLSERLSVDAELEAFYQYFTVDETEFENLDPNERLPDSTQDEAKTFALLVNGLLEWHFTPQFGVYGGAGIGWADVIKYTSWDSGNLSTSDSSGVAYQGRLGLDYNLGGTYDFRFGYRYFKTDAIEVVNTQPAGTSEIDVAQHSLELLFRWSLSGR